MADGGSEHRTARVSAQEALALHASGRPGKLETRISKPLNTARDLSLAYSPGVAEPCLHIHRDPALAYDYTTKGNMVAVISNGTAVLGLGNLGAVASKPVMEGKVALFKRFADVDGIDLEIGTEDVDAFVNAVRYLGPGFGGINLEDIKAPECFIIEQRLRELMDIPVFHDDQHGTAIVAAAGLVNACHLTGRDLREAKLVVNGAGAAAIACVELMKAMGVRGENVILCDTRGVVFRGRTSGMNQWKSAHATGSHVRTLAEALEGADIFFGLSAKGALTPAMVAAMADRPIIFAMANPDPEITPEEARRARPNAIIATGRSDYPNQVNNVLGFPYIFRGALDVRASTINEPMKIAAAEALAKLAREDVPDEVHRASAGSRLTFGPDYIIPNAFDPRLIAWVPPAVARAAMESGVARRPIPELRRYARELSGRLDPTANALDAIMESVRENPQRVVFAEGEDEKTVRAAVAFSNAGYGTPVLIGREELVRDTMSRLGLGACPQVEIHNARLSHANARYTDYLYEKLQRRGYLLRDCQRMVNQNRNVFAACMVATDDADAMITGLTRSAAVSLADINLAIDPPKGALTFGLTLMVGTRGRTIFIADTLTHFRPNAQQMAEIAVGAAQTARRLGHEPRVALLSHSTFGNPSHAGAETMREAVAILDGRNVDFEYDGEMSPDVALEPRLRALYPFCRLTGPANVLLMPGLHSAHITSRLLPRLSSGTTIGPLLIGLRKAAQIVPMDSSVSQIVDVACLAAHQAQALKAAGR
ncbi:MAG: NADP-dependent malic enzyme [Acetobacteraceae bacterium]|nr:NADP-dependent malic enzyme [Acetobacteraceae bacterium]